MEKCRSDWSSASINERLEVEEVQAQQNQLAWISVERDGG